MHSRLCTSMFGECARSCDLNSNALPAPHPNAPSHISQAGLRAVAARTWDTPVDKIVLQSTPRVRGKLLEVRHTCESSRGGNGVGARPHFRSTCIHHKRWHVPVERWDACLAQTNDWAREQAHPRVATGYRVLSVCWSPAQEGKSLADMGIATGTQVCGWLAIPSPYTSRSSQTWHISASGSMYTRIGCM